MTEYGNAIMMEVEDGTEVEASKAAYRIVEHNYNTTKLLNPEYHLGPMQFVAGPVYNSYEEYDDEGYGVGAPKPGVKKYTYGWVADGVEVSYLKELENVRSE